VNRNQRRAVTTALFAAVLAPTVVVAQRTPQRSPIFIGATFQSPGEPKLGIDVGEAVRQRMIRLFPLPAKAGQLRVLTGKEISDYLTSAGYSADSALSTVDLGILGKVLGADESLEGSVKRTAQGVEARARFYSLNFIGAAEVLPVVVEKDANAAGRKIAELYVQARKELPDYERCRNGLINRDLDAAVVSAKASLTQYPQGVLPRACLMGAYFELQKAGKMPIDSVMRVGLEIMSIDPDNLVAVGTLADAYWVKRDTAKAIEMNLRLAGLGSNNTASVRNIIDILRAYGAPEHALPLVDRLLADNQGDAAMIQTRWELLLNTGKWKAALAAGEEMIKYDSSKADTTFFWRQVGAANKDSQPTVMLQLLDRATTKFPKEARLWLAYSQELRRQGQNQRALEAARKALGADSLIAGGFVRVLDLYIALGQADSAMAAAKQALAGNRDTTFRNSVGAALLTLIGPAMNRSQKEEADTTLPAARKRASWEEVYRMSATVDSLVPQGHTAFYMSVAAYYIAAGALPGLPELARTDRARACTEVRYASDMLLVVDLNMSRGGKVDPTTAANILNALTPVRPYLDQVRRAVCRAPLA
jgi:tetratricopeptide (TPR) repeat protein